MPKHGNILALILFFLSSLAQPLLAKAETKTLARTMDPVVIVGKDLAPLLGQPPDKLALMAYRGNSWEPIPFQIDEKKPDGTYAFTSGPLASKDPDPNLDANDELVFMARDTADRAEGKAWPEGAGKPVEIEVTDPQNGKKGWVYLFLFSGKPPRSPKRYVKFEYNKDSKRYRYITDEFVIEIPAGRVNPDYFSVVKPDGSLGPNILDMVKIRLEVIVPVINKRLEFRIDQLIRADSKAWISGPVRVIHFNQGFAQVAQWIKLKIGGEMNITLYPNSIEFPMKMGPTEYTDEANPNSSSTMPPPSKVTPEVNEYIYLDFNSNAYGAHYFSKISPFNDNVVFDGRMSDAEKKLDLKTASSWAALYPLPGGLVARVSQQPIPRIEALLPRIFYFDDKTKIEKPENEPGVSAVGMSLYHLERAETNKPSSVTTTVYYQREFKPENVNDILNIKDHPLKILTRPAGEPR